MTAQIVLGTSPAVDTTVAVGPFRSPQRVSEAAERLTQLGYVVEICDCVPLSDVAASQPWDEGE